MKLSVQIPEKEYDIIIENGLLDSVGQWVSSLWTTRKIMIVTDKTVEALYSEGIMAQLSNEGFDVSLSSVTPGEKSKSFEVASHLYHEFAKFGMTRHDGVIALGGGVVGDLAGFVASTYMRGLPFLQIPTTLLAQVDSSVGGKTAINTPDAKNLVGTFAQPDGVLIDPDTLKTLEPRRLREGLAEIVKSAAIKDKELWERLLLLEDEFDALNEASDIILACCDVKRKVVVEDEFDTSARLLLNFGHTIGHAIENTMGYGVVTHGEAVSMGMIQMSQLGEDRGVTQKGTTIELEKMLQKFHLPTQLPDVKPQELMLALVHDKKVSGDKVNIVLLTDIGHSLTQKVPIYVLDNFLNEGKD